MKSLLICLLAVALFGAAGCSNEQLRQAEHHLSQAQAQLEELQAYRAEAREALAVAEQLHERFGNEQTAQAVVIAQRALAAADEAIPATREAVATMQQTVEQIRQGIEAGDSWLAILSVAAGTIIPGAGVVIEGMRRSRKAWQTEALQERKARDHAVAYARRVETVDPNDRATLDRIKERALTEQKLDGVHDRILESLRG